MDPREQLENCKKEISEFESLLARCEASPDKKLYSQITDRLNQLKKHFQNSTTKSLEVFLKDFEYIIVLKIILYQHN
jgi:hypothetical protein